jgi:hypothetical protein
MSQVVLFGVSTERWSGSVTALIKKANGGVGRMLAPRLSTIQAERLLRNLVALPTPPVLDAGHFKNNYQEQDQRERHASGDPQG